MSNEKTEEVALDPIPWKQTIQKRHIHHIGENVIAHRGLLLAKALDNGIGHSIAVEHHRQGGKPSQIDTGIDTAIEAVAQFSCR